MIIDLKEVPEAPRRLFVLARRLRAGAILGKRGFNFVAKKSTIEGEIQTLASLLGNLGLPIQPGFGSGIEWTPEGLHDYSRVVEAQAYLALFGEEWAGWTSSKLELKEHHQFWTALQASKE